MGYENFTAVFPQYNPIAARYKFYAYLFPFIELFLGFLFVADLMPLFRDIVGVVIFSVGAYGIFKYQSSDRGTIMCACLGTIIRLPLSTVSLIEDVLMAGFGFIMLISYFLI
jgi:hypothetical protein